MPRLPQPCYHKGRQRWYVTLGGKEVYMSGEVPWTKNPPLAVKVAWEQKLAAYLAARAESSQAVGPDPTIDELWLGYLAACTSGPEAYRKAGRPTSELYTTRSACRVVARLYGELPARQFDINHLEAVRAEFIKLGWERNYLNQQVSRVRRLFRWGARKHLIPTAVWLDLQNLPDLRQAAARELGLREQQPVCDIPDAVIEATIPHLPEALRTLVWVHRYVGCRADEVCTMRPCEIDRNADADDVPPAERCWLFTPAASKTGEARYWVGPQAQRVLRPLLDAAASPDAYLFPTVPRGKPGRGCWAVCSYRRAVDRTCKKHDIQHWSPLQVRHRAAEEARQGHVKGLEATQARLSHKEMNVSQKYAHNLASLAREVARKFG